MPSDRATGRPRGFAFVEYSSDEHAAAAIQKFDGFELGGRRLRVSEAAERSASGPGAAPFRSFAGGDAPGRRPPRPKGSRRNIRGRKRSIW